MAVGARGIGITLAGGVLVIVALAAPSSTAVPAPVPAGPIPAAAPVPIPVPAAVPNPTAVPVPAVRMPAAAPGGTPSRWATVTSAAVRPGVVTETAGGGACTSNFVFTSGERTFLGQAAHCAGTGGSTETDGCRSGTAPLGTAVTIRGADGTDRLGTLAYSSWVTMQAGGESDPDTCAYNDFALVELDRADPVNPSVPFFGGPAGIDTDGLVAGEPVETYGNSPARMGIATLRPKVGVSAGEAGGGRSHAIYTISPGIPGDSGSAFLDADGDAVGLLATLNLAPLPVSNGVADLAKALDYADAAGGLGPVALALGTEPFDPVPAGVAAIDLAGPAGPPITG